MKPERQQLLDDVLDEAVPPDFKETLWRHTLEQVRRGNRARRRNRVLLGVAVVAAVPLMMWRLILPLAPTKVQPLPHGIVRSQPPAPAMLVETKPGMVHLITSLADSVAIIKTDPSKRLFREIDDEQLLTLLAGRPAVLIREGPGRASIEFADPADRDGFPTP